MTKPLKRRNLNPRIAPDDVNRFKEISEAQILNIQSKIPEFSQEFLNEELFIEIGKNILKYTNLFNWLASKLIFMTVFLLSPVFFKKVRKFIMENYYYKSSKENRARKSKKFESK